MPHIILKMIAGRSEEQKQAATAELLKAAQAALQCDEKWLSVSIEEFPAEEWTDKVFAPDIRDKADTLYKKPGYDPFASA